MGALFARRRLFDLVNFGAGFAADPWLWVRRLSAGFMGGLVSGIQSLAWCRALCSGGDAASKLNLPVQSPPEKEFRRCVPCFPVLSVVCSALSVLPVLGFSLLIGCELRTVRMNGRWSPGLSGAEGNDAPLTSVGVPKVDVIAGFSIPSEGKADVVLPKQADVLSLIQTSVKPDSRGACPT